MRFSDQPKTLRPKIEILSHHPKLHTLHHNAAFKSLSQNPEPQTYSDHLRRRPHTAGCVGEPVETTTAAVGQVPVRLQVHPRVFLTIVHSTVQYFFTGPVTQVDSSITRNISTRETSEQPHGVGVSLISGK